MVTDENQGRVWQTLYGRITQTVPNKPKFNVGDFVRVSKTKMHFEKGYEQNWTREIFSIHQIVPRNPVVYKISDLSGEVIEGTFYEPELNRVVDSGFYPVEKILQTRKRKGKTEYFVKFQGYPDKFNDWVQELYKND